MTLLSPFPAPGVPDPAAPALPRVDPITFLPVLILFPHSRCNCRCLMCDIWKDRTAREISAADVASWLGDFRRLGLKHVVLSGGEALMHSHLAELCTLLTGAGIGLTLLTSGLLLRRDAAALAPLLAEVIVSLDGPREVHDAIRNVPRAFDRLAEGVLAVRFVRPSLCVTGRCTVQRANHAHLRATVAAARALGLSRISFLAADTTSEAFGRPGGPEPEQAARVGLTHGELPVLAAELNALERENAADFASGFLAESPEKLRRRLLAHFAALAGAGEPAPNECNAPWVSAVVESDGTVRPCFFHPPIGRLGPGASLPAILNSKEARAFRARLDVRADPVCRRCVCSLNLRENASR